MKRDPVLTDLRAKFNYAFKQTNEQRSSEFFLLFNEYIQEQAGVKGWGKDMVDVYTRLRDKLQRFNPELTFLTLNTKNLEAFKIYLSESMYNDALKKNLAYLKSFVKWAKKKHYTVCEEFDSYKPKLPKGHISVKYLSLDELDCIYNLNLEEGSALDQTRDFFIFQCYTALRYSDLKQLRPDNITKSDDGKFIIRLLTEKDDDAVSYPLAQRAVEIYKKYSTHIYDGGRLFPILSNQKYNEHLKELGKKANLSGEWIDYEYRLQEKIEVHTPKCDLSTHTARRTFIVTALNEGVSTNLIMLITSHSDYKAMRPYIKATMKGTGSVINAIDKTYTNNKNGREEKSQELDCRTE
jgi:integrase